MPEARYLEVFESLKRRILNREFDADHPLPSEAAIARTCGLSKITVHRAYQELRNLGLVAGGKGAFPHVVQERVSRSIGLIVPGLSYTEFFAPVISAISKQAQSKGYSLIFADVSSADPNQRVCQVRKCARDMIAAGVAGIIYQPLELLSDVDRVNKIVTDAFRRAHIAVVLLDSDIVSCPARSTLDVIGINNIEAGYRLAEHLIVTCGAKRIAFQMRPYWAPSVRNRLRGIQQAAEALDATCRVFVGQPNDVRSLKGFLRKERPDAFISGNDTAAADLKQSLAEAGLSVPEDILLAGFDDTRISRTLTPPLTTIHQPCEDIGRLAFDMILNRIANPKATAQEIYLPAPLVIRASTRKK